MSSTKVVENAAKAVNHDGDMKAEEDLQAYSSGLWLIIVEEDVITWLLSVL